MYLQNRNFSENLKKANLKKILKEDSKEVRQNCLMAVYIDFCCMQLFIQGERGVGIVLL